MDQLSIAQLKQKLAHELRVRGGEDDDTTMALRAEIEGMQAVAKMEQTARTIEGARGLTHPTPKQRYELEDALRFVRRLKAQRAQEATHEPTEDEERATMVGPDGRRIPLEKAR